MFVCFWSHYSDSVYKEIMLSNIHKQDYWPNLCLFLD